MFKPRAHKTAQGAKLKAIFELRAATIIKHYNCTVLLIYIYR